MSCGPVAFDVNPKRVQVIVAVPTPSKQGALGGFTGNFWNARGDRELPDGRPKVHMVERNGWNAQLWIKAKKCRTKLAQTKRNEDIFKLIDRAEKWLAVNKVTNPILKWETKAWGEIPADFGRK